MALLERIVPEPIPQLALNTDLQATLLLGHGCNVVRQGHSVEAQRADVQRVATQKALEPQALKNSVQEHIFVVVPDISAPDPATRVAAQNLGGQRSGGAHSGSAPHTVGQSVVSLVCMPVRGSANPVVLVVALALSRAVEASQALRLAEVLGGAEVLGHAEVLARAQDLGRAQVRRLAQAQVALQGRVAHLFRVQFRIAHPTAGLQKPALDHHKLAVQELMRAMRECAGMQQSPVVSTRKAHRIQMATPALAAQSGMLAEKQAEQRASEKPQVATAAQLD